MHFYNQLELKYLKCLIEKENWFSKSVKKRVSLFYLCCLISIISFNLKKVFIETIYIVNHSIASAIGNIMNGFFSELFLIQNFQNKS